MNNRLTVALPDFRDALKTFRTLKHRLGPVLLCFESGYLSIESGGATSVVRAVGEWHGRARFSHEILRALATYPPTHGPVVIAYDDNCIHLAGMKIACEWEAPGANLVTTLENPGLLDLVALGRTISRAELGSSERGRKIRHAGTAMETRLKKAAAQLADLAISEEDLRALVESRIASRHPVAAEPSMHAPAASSYLAFLEAMAGTKRAGSRNPELSRHMRAILKAEIAILDVAIVEFKRHHSLEK